MLASEKKLFLIRAYCAVPGKKIDGTDRVGREPYEPEQRPRKTSLVNPSLTAEDLGS